MKYLCINVDNGSSQIVDDFAYVQDNFLFSEIACKDGSDVIVYSERLMGLVQAIRDVVGGLTINSAFRTPSHNKAVGGVDGSYHLYGCAVDIAKPRSLTIDEFADII